MTTSQSSSPLGAVLRDGEGYRLEFVRTYPDPVERVWAAITESSELEGWFGTWTGDPDSGTVEMHFREAPEPGPVAIRKCTPPTHLSVILPSPDGPWPLSLDLESTDAGTTLTFVHELAEPDDATSVGPGWQYYLDRFGAYLIALAHTSRELRSPVAGMTTPHSAKTTCCRSRPTCVLSFQIALHKPIYEDTLTPCASVISAWPWFRSSSRLESRQVPRVQGTLPARRERP